MTPYFGVSLIIWTGILSITLIALALGYYLGGRASGKAQDARNRSLHFLFLLMPATAALSIALSCALYPKIFHQLAQFSLVFGAFGACMLLLFTPLLAISAMNPLLIAIRRSNAEASQEQGDSGSGTVFFLSTVGSVAGVSFTAFVFIPNISNFNALLILGAALSVISLVGASLGDYLLKKQRQQLIAISILGWTTCGGMLLIGSDYLNKNAEIEFNGLAWRIDREYRSLFGTTKIISRRVPAAERQDHGPDRFHRIYYTDGIIHNVVDSEGYSHTPFTYALEYLGLGFRPDASSVLILGLGAGVIPIKLAGKGFEVEVVEIDPSSVAAAMDFFDFDPSKVRLIRSDARTYVRSCSRTYDIVLVDLIHGDGLPGYLVSREFFAGINRCLGEEGVAVFNTFAALDDMFAYYHVVKTIGAAFPEILMFHDGETMNRPGLNIYLVGTKGNRPQEISFPWEPMPPDVAINLRKVLSQPRPIDQKILTRASVLDDDSNAFRFINIGSDLVFRSSVLRSLPPNFLVN